MGKISIPLTISMTVLIGCCATHNVQRDAALQWAPKVFDQLAETRVRVELQSGRVCEGELVTLDEEEIQLSNQNTGTSLSLPIDSITSISSDSNAGWITLGALGGAIAGCVAGAAIGTDVHREADSSAWFVQTNVTIEGFYGAFIGAMVGAIVGAGAVAMVTLTHDYIIVHSVEVPQQPTTR